MRLNICFIFLTLIPFCSTKATVPTFLIDYDQVMNHLFISQNPYIRTSVSKFANIVLDAVTQSSVTIIFVEQQLCTEDITMKDLRGTPYSNLRENLLAYKVKYMPNVATPLKLLTGLLEPTEYNVFILKPDEVFEPTEDMRFFYIFFKDNRNETRINMLRRHDKVMQDVYETTRRIANGAVIAFYTGKMNPVKYTMYRTGRTDVLYGEDPDDITMASLGAMIRFKGLIFNEPPASTRRANPLGASLGIIRSDQSTVDNSDSSDNSTNSTESTTDVAIDKYHLEFFFLFKGEYWILKSATLFLEDKTLYKIEEMNIQVPYGRSYFCDEPLVFYIKEEEYNIIIPTYQIQPYRQEDLPAESVNGTNGTNGTNNTDQTRFIRSILRDLNGTNYTDDNDTDPTKYLEFGKPVRCTNYFTISILMGLVVFGVFVTILLFGIFALTQIETNDRFDDPHGPPFYTTTLE